MTTFEYKGKTWRLAFRHTVDHRTTFRRTLFKHVTTVRYRYGTTATLAVRQEHAYVGRGGESPCELCRKAERRTVWVPSESNRLLYEQRDQLHGTHGWVPVSQRRVRCRQSSTQWDVPSRKAGREAALGGLLEDLDDRDLAGAVRQAYVAALAAARAKGVSKEKEDSSHGV